MPRIIAGVAGGRLLRAPRGRGTRPTSDRVREALFSTLEALVGGLAGRGFADLYAGSGAVGLEAASRGAAPVLLVESAPAAAASARANAERLQLAAQVRAERVERAVGTAPPAAFDVVFLDPPYALDVTPVLDLLVANSWLAPGGVLVVERAARDGSPGWPAGVRAEQTRRYGDTALWYGRRS